MDFSLLSLNELNEFLSQDVSQYQITLPKGSKVRKAEYLFSELIKHPEAQFPTPVVDLYSAYLFDKNNDVSENLKYFPEQILNMSKEETSQFAQIFGLVSNGIQDDRVRILKILSFLGLIFRDEPANILFQHPIDELLYKKMNIQDLNKYRQAWNFLSLLGPILVKDSDGLITSVNELNNQNFNVIRRIERSGSRTGLIILILNRKIEGVKYLLDLGLDFNFELKYHELEGLNHSIRLSLVGKTPLAISAQYSSLDIFKLFLEYGADINEIDAIGDTLLHYTAMSGNVSVGKYLISQGFDITQSNLVGRNTRTLAKKWLGTREGNKFIQEIQA